MMKSIVAKVKVRLVCLPLIVAVRLDLGSEVQSGDALLGTLTSLQQLRIISSFPSNTNTNGGLIILCSSSRLT